MRRLPPLAAVRVFEAAARHGNFTRAAEELGMTQAAVSYQMKLLEERLGAPLFQRLGRGIVLTDHGRRIAPQVTGAFDALGDAFAAIRAENESVLSISAPTTFSTNWLSGRLGGFQLSRPELAVRLDVSDTIADLASGEVDVAIRGSPHGWPGLVSHFLMRMPFTPLASPSLLERYPPIHEPADLLALPRLSPDEIWWQLWFDVAAGGPPEGKAIPSVGFESQVLQGSAAIAGHGLAVLSPPMWQAAMAAGQLVQPLPQVALYRNSFWLVYPEAKRGLAKIRAFRDWMIAEVKAGLADDPYGALVPPPESAA
jgi:LysR family transcriptional regulator, glycine cleavage system transcriptional activator